MHHATTTNTPQTPINDVRSGATTQVEAVGTTAALSKNRRIVQAGTEGKSNPPMADKRNLHTEDKTNPHTEDKNSPPTAVVAKTKTRRQATAVGNSRTTLAAMTHDNNKNTHSAAAMVKKAAVKKVMNTLPAVVATADKRSRMVEAAIEGRKIHTAADSISPTVVTKDLEDSKRSHMESSRATVAMRMRMRIRSMALVAATVLTIRVMESDGKMRMSTVGTEKVCMLVAGCRARVASHAGTGV